MTRPTFCLTLMAAAVVASCGLAPRSAMQSVPAMADERTKMLAEVKDALDGADMASGRHIAPMSVTVAAPPMLTGLGFAQISGQPGKTQNEKRLMAIRAARVDALRDLTEQVHGIRIDAETTVLDTVAKVDRLNAVVQGSLRGAKTVRITPKGTDGYEVQMSLDRDTVGYILRATRGAL